MSKKNGVTLTVDEIDHIEKNGLDGFQFADLCQQARAAVALEEQIEVLTDLDKFDVQATKMGVKGQVQGAGAGLMAAIMSKPLFDTEAPNYVECRFWVKDPKTKKQIELTYTVQRITGKTPHEKRQEAEAEVEKWKAVAMAYLNAEFRDRGLIYITETPELEAAWTAVGGRP